MTTGSNQSWPRIASLATAVPPHRVPQDEAMDFFQRSFDIPPSRRGRLKQLFLNAEIETRYAAAPIHWYEHTHSFELKNDLYIDRAIDLLKQVTIDSLTAAGLACSDVDTLVTVSSTGVAVPALDVRLMEELPFRRNVQRLPVFGLGCAGGALGLARAAACARAQPGSRTLCLVFELCTLTFCRSDQTTANIVATALFGDGAAGAVLTTDGPGPAIRAWGEHTWPRSLDVMGWHVTQKGLELRLSRGVPDFARHRVRRVTDEFLASVGLELADVDDFICHPGGSKVLEALEDAFDLPAGGLAASREILRDYGNMSAATVLFILKRALVTSAADNGRRGEARRYLMTGLGPGFSIGHLVLESD